MERCNNFIKEMYLESFHISLYHCFFLLQSEMITNEQNQKNCDDARNALEAYMYKTRNNFAKDGELAPYLNDKERLYIGELMNSIGKWLERDVCDIDKYKAVLRDLQNFIHPIETRHIKRNQQLTALNELHDTIRKATGTLTEHRDVLKLSDEAKKLKKWYDKQIETITTVPMTEDLPYNHLDILEMQKTLNVYLNIVQNLPKPMLSTGENDQSLGKHQSLSPTVAEPNGVHQGVWSISRI